MEPKEEVHSDDGSYEMVNEDDYANQGLSDDSSYDMLCSEVSETLVLTEDEDNPSDVELKYEQFKNETDSDSIEGDMGLDRETDPDLDRQPVLDRVRKGKKRDLMTMLQGISYDNLYFYPDQFKLKNDIKEVAKNHIIRYLPAKSLFKCRQVSKEWNNWISCPFFAHTQSQYFRKTSGFFQTSKSSTVTRFISLENPAYGVPSPNLDFLPTCVSVKSSCNGLLLCRAFNDEEVVYICNPVNKEWVSIPPSSSYHGVDPKFVLAFEPSKLDFIPHYQVICLYSFPFSDMPPMLCFDVYDSQTKLWRESSVICPGFDVSDVTSDAIFVNGVAYWETKGGCSGGLLAFDLKNDIYSVQMLAIDDSGALTNILGVICYVRARYDHAIKSCVLEIYGDGVMSLKKTVRISVDDIEDGEFVDCKVVANSCDDAVAFVVMVSQMQKRLYVYNVNDGKVQGPVVFSHSKKLFPYVNSLVSIGA